MLNLSRFQLVLAALFTVLAVSSCSGFSPGCGSDKAVAKVLDTIKAQSYNVSDVEIERVHTLRTNFATGEVLCSAAAVVKTVENAERKRVSVGYNVYYDTDRRLAVSVYGAEQ